MVVEVDPSPEIVEPDGIPLTPAEEDENDPEPPLLELEGLHIVVPSGQYIAVS